MEIYDAAILVLASRPVFDFLSSKNNSRYCLFSTADFDAMELFVATIKPLKTMVF